MIIKQSELATLRILHERHKIVYCSGSFDLFHPGHRAFLEHCKQYGDVLIVGVGSDHDITINKGAGRPIDSEDKRLERVNYETSVDYCFIQCPMTDIQFLLEPLVIDLMELKPNMYIFGPDSLSIQFRKRVAKDLGITPIVMERHGDWSTTELIGALRAS